MDCGKVGQLILSLRKEKHLTQKQIANAMNDRLRLVKLYPEQGSEVRFPKMRGGKLYFHCSQHGLWVNG